MHPIQDLIAQADQAINREDLETLMSFYAEDAVLVVQPGQVAVGRGEIRAAFEKIAEFFKHGVTVTQESMVVLEAGDTALVLADTHVEAPNSPKDERKATYVYRKVEGQWLCAIDNSYGHRVLEQLP
ncbi:MAG: SgcJ/EcaC family oxidoreductase [Pseudomonadota bacterium]